MRNKEYRKALFLDRDGVINQDYGYVHKCDHFDFLEGVFNVVRLANELNFVVVVVTNQAGIARGYYSEADFVALTKWMINEFAANECRIDEVFFCPYHPHGIIPELSSTHPDRKPGIGMVLRAQRKFNLDLKQSILVGDQITDIQCAVNAGIGTAILFKESGAPSAITSQLEYYDLRSEVLYGEKTQLFQISNHNELSMYLESV